MEARERHKSPSTEVADTILHGPVYPFWPMLLLLGGLFIFIVNGGDWLASLYGRRGNFSNLSAPALDWWCHWAVALAYCSARAGSRSRMISYLSLGGGAPRRSRSMQLRPPTAANTSSPSEAQAKPSAAYF